MNLDRPVIRSKRKEGEIVPVVNIRVRCIGPSIPDGVRGLWIRFNKNALAMDFRLRWREMLVRPGDCESTRCAVKRMKPLSVVKVQTDFSIVSASRAELRGQKAEVYLINSSKRDFCQTLSDFFLAPGMNVSRVSQINIAGDRRSRA